MQQLGQGATVTAGDLDRDRSFGVSIEFRGWADAGDQGVDGAGLEFAAVVASPSDNIFGQPPGQDFATGVEPGDDAIGVEILAVVEVVDVLVVRRSQSR